MNNRSNQILSAIKDCLLEPSKTQASYEYKCPKCGLTLEFNRNQSYVKCPNDGHTMYRTN